MVEGYETLTEKEKQTLRLMVRGHDAKSMANALALSVHTVNDRLRAARRKLGVTSSREAARRLHDHEGAAPQNPAYKELGAAADQFSDERESGPRDLRDGLERNLLVGVVIMIVCIAAVVLALQGEAPSTPPAATTEQPAHSASRAVDPAMQERLEAADRAARAFIGIVDAEDFAFDTASLETGNRDFAAWNGLIERRRDHGRTIERETQRIDMIERDGLDRWIVRYRTDFENFRGAYEKITLGHEGGTFVAVEYAVE